MINQMQARAQLATLRNNPMVANNPIAMNVYSAIDSGNEKELLQLFRNVCNSKGLNADEELQKLGIK